MGLYQTGTVNRIYSANNRQQIYLISNQKVLRNGGTAAGGFFLFLKGVRHKIFDLYFFYVFSPIQAPDKKAKVFSNSVFDFAGIFDHKARKIRLRRVHDTAESKL